MTAGPRRPPPGRERRARPGATRERRSSESTDFTIGLEEEFAIVDPGERSSSSTASRTCTRPASRDDLLAESAAGELIASEIEIRSGRGETLRRGGRAPARAPGAAVRARRGDGARARRDGDPSVGQLPRPADHRHAALPAAQATTSAGSRSATTPGACTSTWGCAAPTARSRSATALRELLPLLLAVSANSPFLDRRDTGLHSVRTRDLHPRLPALRDPRAVRQLGRSTRDFVELLARTGHDRRVDAAVVERAARTTPSAPSRCGSATRRRGGEESFGLAALIAACVAQTALDYDEGRLARAAAPARDRGEPVARDPLRDGRRADRLRARRGGRGARPRSSAASSGPRRRATSSGSRSRFPSANGAQRARRALEAGESIEEIYRQAVAETRRTYVPQGSTV